jgi:hypothetical protein
MQRLGSLPVTPEADRDRHAPVADRLRHVIERGQRTGEFDAGCSPDWLIAVTVTLGHTAAEQVDAGRMTSTEARQTLHTTLLRVLAASNP